MAERRSDPSKSFIWSPLTKQSTPLLQQSNPGVQFGTASNTGQCGRDMNVLPY